MIDPLPPAVITCPVLDCEWTHDASGPPPASRQRETLAGMFSSGVYAAAAATQQAWDLERTLTEHFVTHTTVEYVRTMAHQRAQLAEESAQREAATAAMGRLQLALADLSAELEVDTPTDGELDMWTRAMRAAVMKLRRGRTAASGRGWAQ